MSGLCTCPKCGCAMEPPTVEIHPTREQLIHRIINARAALLRIWPKGNDCEHQAAREAFLALGGSPNPVADGARSAPVKRVVGLRSEDA